MMQYVRCRFAGAIAVWCVLALSAYAQNDAQAPDGNQEKKADSIETKVYRIKHCNATDVANVMNNLIGSGTSGGIGFPGGGGAIPPVDPGDPPGFPNVPPGGAPGGNFPGNPGGRLGGFGGGPAPGGFVGGAGMPGFPSIRQTSIVSDSRTHTVIVRGPKSDVDIATDIVAVLDYEPGKAPPAVKRVWSGQLKHANVNHIKRILYRLNFNVRIVTLPKTKQILMAGSDDEIKQVTEVLQKLDVETPKDTKRRRFFDNPGGLRPPIDPAIPPPGVDPGVPAPPTIILPDPPAEPKPPAADPFGR